MARLTSNGRRPLLIPGSAQRAIRRPDPRGLIVPQPSAAPLSGSEVDYDDLTVIRSWRVFEPASPTSPASSPRSPTASVSCGFDFAPMIPLSDG